MARIVFEVSAQTPNSCPLWSFLYFGDSSCGPIEHWLSPGGILFSQGFSLLDSDQGCLGPWHNRPPETPRCITALALNSMAGWAAESILRNWIWTFPFTCRIIAACFRQNGSLSTVFLSPASPSFLIVRLPIRSLSNVVNHYRIVRECRWALQCHTFWVPGLTNIPEYCKAD